MTQYSNNEIRAILLIGIVMGFVLGWVWNDIVNDANAHILCEDISTSIATRNDGCVSYDKNGAHNAYHIAGLVEQILEEEKKQTALLDHIDCLTFYQDHSIRFHGYKGCGSPLNVTGVYHP